MTRLALFLAAMGALFLLGRRLEPRAVPAPIDDLDWFREWPIDRTPYLTAAEWRN